MKKLLVLLYIFVFIIEGYSQGDLGNDFKILNQSTSGICYEQGSDKYITISYEGNLDILGNPSTYYTEWTLSSNLEYNGESRSPVLITPGPTNTTEITLKVIGSGDTYISFRAYVANNARIGH